jgi:hypothetical protein
MKKLAGTAFVAGLALMASSPSFAQGFSAVSVIVHSSVVGYCEGRELTQKEAEGTAIGWSTMWQAMRDCQANRAKRQAAPAAAQTTEKKK